MRTRVTDLLGVEYPILQAPMGYIARARLASAVSNAGGMGIIETSSGQLDQIRDEIACMRDLTDKPFGVNIAQLLVRDRRIVDFVYDQGVRFVTTSAGDPTVFTTALHEAGITVFHVVPSLRAALKAVAAGVDGIVAEGGEGGGFKATRDVASMVLIPLVCARVDVPVVAAGGIADGRSMAAAFALGAEGVQMGTRFLASAESPVHQNYKQLVVDTPETGTIMLNRFHKPGYRVLATPRSEQYEQHDGAVTLGTLDGTSSSISKAISMPRSPLVGRSPAGSTRYGPSPRSCATRSTSSTPSCRSWPCGTPGRLPARSLVGGSDGGLGLDSRQPCASPGRSGCPVRRGPLRR